MKEFGLFIDGASQAASDGKTFESLNPATGEPWARVAAGRPADVERAVTAARQAHRDGRWRAKSAAERADVLEAIAMAVFERQAELATAEAEDSGGTIRKANTADIPATAQTFLYYAGLVRQHAEEEEHAEAVPVTSRNIIRREPIGVCAGIVPFNFPLASASWKIAPALAAGNTLVLKPSPHTPVTALMLAEICHKAGVPAGVVNVVAGPDADLGEALVTHPHVDKIAFTGSTKVGRQVMEAAAKGLKALTLELGGKSPNIILEDANLDGAVRGALFGTFFHQGQVCESGTRVLVHASLYSAFIDQMVAAAKEIVIGDTLDPNTTMGPLVSEGQRANTERYVALGKQEGADLVLGGQRPPASRAATTTSPRSSGGSRTPCASRRRRSSARWFPSFPSRTTPRRSASPTIPSTAWEQPSGRVIPSARSAWRGRSRPAPCGSTTTTCSTSASRSAATSRAASAASSDRGGWRSTSRSSTSTSASPGTRRRSSTSRCCSPSTVGRHT